MVAPTRQILVVQKRNPKLIHVHGFQVVEQDLVAFFEDVEPDGFTRMGSSRNWKRGKGIPQVTTSLRGKSARSHQAPGCGVKGAIRDGNPAYARSPLLYMPSSSTPSCPSRWA